MIRDIVKIDEDLCDGCGLCVPGCEEGAIRLVDGKARIVSDRLCDGMGVCLGHCPRGAISIERREADAFSEAAVIHQQQQNHAVEPFKQGLGVMQRPASASAGGCPGARFAQFGGAATAEQSERRRADSPDAPSALTHWPVQLRLLSPDAPMLRHADVLVAADCVPVAYADFQQQLLRGRAVVIACPKLDDTSGYVQKLADIIRRNDLASITVARMEVPCCTGILQTVLEARRQAGRDMPGSEVPVTEVVISIRGECLAHRPH